MKGDELPRLLDNPAEFIESREYFSWEAFFTATLTRLARGTRFAYRKSHLNNAYLDDSAIAAIRSAMANAIGLLP